MTYICYNGSFYNDNTPVIHHSNRAFCFGDAIFETIRANGTHLLFFDDHYKRIMKGLSLLNIDLTEDITREKLQKHIEKLLHKNKYYTGTRIRLTIFRNTESKGYEPFNNTPGFLIETKKLSNPEFELNSKGQIIDLFNDIKKPVTPFSTVKCSNADLHPCSYLQKRKRV